LGVGAAIFDFERAPNFLGLIAHLDGHGTERCDRGIRQRHRRQRLRRHNRRLSGPLLDRMDLLINVERPTEQELRAGPKTSSAQARDRVAHARERQRRARGLRAG